MTYFSGRKCGGRKVRDASVETVAGDLEKHFHELAILFPCHNLLKLSLFCRVEAHDIPSKKRFLARPPVW